MTFASISSFDKLNKILYHESEGTLLARRHFFLGSGKCALGGVQDFDTMYQIKLLLRRELLQQIFCLIKKKYPAKGYFRHS